MTIDQMIEREQHRADSFRFLSALFYQPNKSLFQEEGFFGNLKQAISKAFPEALLYAEQMEESFKKYLEEELLVDYSALFVGPFELKAPPYASVYFGADKRLMGDSTLSIIDFYKRSGLAISEDFGDVPDHIKVILEFIYYLTYKQAEALKNKDYKQAMGLLDKQKEFLNTYLTPWIEPFCQKIRDNAETEYYSSIAACLLKVVKDNVSLIDNTLKSCSQVDVKRGTDK